MKRLLFLVLMALSITTGILVQKPGFLLKARRFVTLGGLDREFSEFGERFRSQAAATDVAFLFEHLAVQTTQCSRASCVVAINSGRDFEAFDYQLLGGARTTDFFSDRQAFLRVTPAFPGDRRTRLKSFEPLDLTRLRRERRKDAHATWTLSDAKSEPFPLLRKVGSTGFTLVDELAPKILSAESGRWSFFSAIRGKADVSALKQSYFIVYDGFRKEHYFAQRSIDVLDCATDVRCAEIAKKIAPSYDVAKLKDGIVALDLRPVDFKALAGAIPKHNGLGSWWNQAPDDYLFPSNGASIYVPNNQLLATPADARRFSAFYRDGDKRGVTMAIPVRLDSYALEADGKSEHKLVRRSFPQDKDAKPETVVSGLPSDHKIVFTRQLGTRRLGVTLYQASDPAGKEPGRSVRAFSTLVRDRVPGATDTPKGIGALDFSVALGAPSADVSAYAKAHATMSFAGKAQPVDLVFGYWVAPRGAKDPLPTESSWTPIGRAKLAVGGEPVSRLEMIGKPGRSVDAFAALQSTLDGLAGLGGHRLAAEKKPTAFDVHFAAMVCAKSTDAFAANVSYPAPLEVSRAFLEDIPKAVGVAAAAAKDGPDPVRRLSLTMVKDRLGVKIGVEGEHDASQDPFFRLAEGVRTLEHGKEIAAAVAAEITKLRAQVKSATECTKSGIDLVSASAGYGWEPFPLGLTCRALERLDGHSLDQLWQVVSAQDATPDAFATARGRLVVMLTRAALMQQTQVAFDERYRKERPRERCLPASGDYIDGVLGALLVPIALDAAQVVAQSSDTGAKIAAAGAEAMWRGEAGDRRTVFHDSARPRPMGLMRGVKMRGPDLRGQKLHLQFTLRTLDGAPQTPDTTATTDAAAPAH